jgi:hypothetical protein
VANRSQDKDLENLGKQLLEKFSNAARVGIYSRALNTAPLSEIWCNGELGQLLGMDGERVLGNVEKWKRTILVEDARTDKLLREVERPQFKSCLAVPVFDESRDLKGVIYLTSPEAKAFNTHGRFACENLAKEAAPILEQHHKRGVGDDVEHKKGPFDYLLSRQALIAVVVLVVLGGFALFSTPAEVIDPTAGNRHSAKIDSKGVAKTFLQHLRVGEFNQGWELLSPDLQRSWSREQFTSSLQAWTESEERQVVLLNRNVAGVKIEEDVVTAVLYGTTFEGDDGKQWDWELEEVDGRWRLVRLSGPVLMR